MEKSTNERLRGVARMAATMVFIMAFAFFMVPAEGKATIVVIGAIALILFSVWEWFRPGHQTKAAQPKPERA